MQQQPPLQKTGMGRLAMIVMGAGALSLLAAGVLFVLIVTGKVDEGSSGPGTATAFGQIDLAAFLTPSAAPTEPPSEAPITRFRIPRFEIDAPVVALGVRPDGVMESPDGPVDVAWYEFTARPGFGSNAVFSGHVDYINYGPAVFWNLKDLEMGDVIEVHLNDGTVYRYEVAGRDQVAADAPAEVINDIIGGTEQEIITLITCGGPFDASVGQYDERVIVRAERVYDDSSPAGLPDDTASLN